MAPKRAAKKAAPPPPPPPPAASSEESESRSRSEESEGEDAESPPPAPTPAPNSTPAPPQEGEEEEEESEEEDEEESDEEPAHAAPAAAATPKNKPPPPQQGGDSDSSSDEEEEEPTKAAPPSALKKQPPPPPPPRQSEESDASDEEEEEGESEEEAPPPPPPKLAPKQAPEGRKPQAAAETKKPAAFNRIWSTDDEVRILEALAAHQKQHGTLPQPDALVDALAGKLDNRAYGSKELQGKVLALRRRYLLLSKKGEPPSKEHDRRVLELSKMVWEGGDTAAAAPAKAANGQEPKGFEEMCELYPYLAEQVRELDAANPGIFKRQFGMMDDDKARAMDEKIKRQRVAQMKVELRRHDLAREVTKAIIDLVD
ncbi:hypothetical protein CFC21_089424 [Triticum aestivum]|uniref:Glabrous enhancer-binding protein-like DBD domain-containing protein n=2 Tax=Triticum aestivum TaxID=4565 RepID=A0A9R1LD04_WHEAT|nr:STOREKEEPER protein-like [Triticum aestivum]KAF7086079.1 hypothetical protein CFC21_089424 [Triticum aestivum]